MRLKATNLYLYIEELISGWSGYSLINSALGAAIIGLCAWLFFIWTEPLDLTAGEEKIVTVEAKADSSTPEDPSSYSVIVEQDLFSPARQKYVVLKPKPAPVVPLLPPAPPPRRPPPRLTLIGTVLLDDGEAAIMNSGGDGQKAAYYRIGDVIEEFAVKDIRKDSVVLERDDGEVLKVTMSSVSPRSQGVHTPQRQPDRSDIPSALVPRPRAQGAGAATPQSPVMPPGGGGAYRPLTR